MKKIISMLLIITVITGFFVIPASAAQEKQAVTEFFVDSYGKTIAVTTTSTAEAKNAPDVSGHIYSKQSTKTTYVYAEEHIQYISGSAFRQTIAGSDTRYAFHHKGSSGQVYVFEATVDMLSFITLYPEDWQRHSYIALDGLSPKALFQFLHDHDDMQEACLCLDNDTAGINARKRISAQLREKGYTEISVLLPTLKDWNDALRSHLEQNLQQVPVEPALEMD